MADVEKVRVGKDLRDIKYSDIATPERHLHQRFQPFWPAFPYGDDVPVRVGGYPVLHVRTLQSDNGDRLFKSPEVLELAMILADEGKRDVLALPIADLHGNRLQIKCFAEQRSGRQMNGDNQRSREGGERYQSGL